MSIRLGRSEAQIIFACDRVVEQFGGRVVRLMPGRTDGQQSPGIARRRYYLGLQAMWWAPRSERGRLGAQQRTFLMSEHATGQIVGAGDDFMLRDVLRSLRDTTPEQARALAWSFVVCVAGRD